MKTSKKNSQKKVPQQKLTKKTPFRFEPIQPRNWERGRLRDLLRRQMKKKKILVVGDVGLDRYTIGTVERISPEAPVPIVLVEQEQHKLGLAANVADNVQTLGGVPYLLGVVGRDRIAQDFKGLLRSAKISSNHLIADASRRTVLKERVVSERQQLLRVDYETVGYVGAEIERKLLASYKSLLGQVDAVIIEDYAKGLLTQELMQELFVLAKKKGLPIAVDPNAKTPVEWYRGSTLLTPNTREAEKLSGVSIRDDESLGQAGQAILKATNADHVVITRGKDGMAIFSRDQREVRLIPTYAREVYDVSGAGDTVIAVLALGISAGATIEEACILGNLAAGVEVGKRGTATVTPEEVEVALEFFATMGV